MEEEKRCSYVSRNDITKQYVGYVSYYTDDPYHNPMNIEHNLVSYVYYYGKGWGEIGTITNTFDEIIKAVKEIQQAIENKRSSYIYKVNKEIKIIKSLKKYIYLIPWLYKKQNYVSKDIIRESVLYHK
jgi:hypothetical protein